MLIKQETDVFVRAILSLSSFTWRKSVESSLTKGARCCRQEQQRQGKR